MKKKMYALVAALLALSMVLGGCGKNPVKQAQKEMEEVRKKHAVAAATYAGGEVTVAESLGNFNSIFNEMYYTYKNYFGYEMSGDEVLQLMQDVLYEHVRMEITAARFDEEHTLSEEEIAQVEADTKAQYESLLESAKSAVEEGSEEAKTAQAELALLQAGLDYDSIHANFLMMMKYDNMRDMLRAQVEEISEEELLAAYEDRVFEDEEAYAGGGIESIMTREDALVCWMPEGYRTVRHILLMPDEETKLARIDANYAVEDMQHELSLLEEELADTKDDDSEEGPARSEEELKAAIAEMEAEIARLELEAKAAEQACLDAVKEKSDEIYARLAAGEDFIALIDEFGEDPGMQREPTRSRGYYVSAASTNWVAPFRDASMALANVGDYTLEPVVSDSGVHIICYASDVTSGAVPFEQVRDALLKETMEEAREEHCENVISEWVAEKQPLYDVDALARVFVEE